MRIRPADIPALAVAAVIAAYGLYLLIVGPEVTFFTPDGPGTTFRQPTFAGLLPVLAGLLVWLGIARQSAAITWIGGVLAGLFSVLFLFSAGGILIPLAAALLAALIVRRLVV